jgi:hypothetical protein
MSKRNKMILSAIMGIGIVGGLILSPYMLVASVVAVSIGFIVYCVLTEFFD